jgi:hypothetical protein
MTRVVVLDNTRLFWTAGDVALMAGGCCRGRGLIWVIALGLGLFSG